MDLGRGVSACYIMYPHVSWQLRAGPRRRCGSEKHRGRTGGTLMQLVERHVIKRADARYAALDAAAFASKNLYNAANYVVRQAFIHEGVYLNYLDIDRRMQGHDAYKALPATVAQW